MPKTHRVLRPISGVDHLTPGDLVDVTGWILVDKLVDQRYLEKLTEAEIKAQEATEAAKIVEQAVRSVGGALTALEERRDEAARARGLAQSRRTEIARHLGHERL